jgi:hypothetical protein
VFPQPGQPEVDHDGAGWAEHDIGWFEVAVHQPGLLDAAQALDEKGTQHRTGPGVQRAVLLDLPLQAASGYEHDRQPGYRRRMLDAHGIVLVERVAGRAPGPPGMLARPGCSQGLKSGPRQIGWSRCVINP